MFCVREAGWGCHFFCSRVRARVRARGVCKGLRERREGSGVSASCAPSPAPCRSPSLPPPRAWRVCKWVTKKSMCFLLENKKMEEEDGGGGSESGGSSFSSAQLCFCLFSRRGASLSARLSFTPSTLPTMSACAMASRLAANRPGTSSRCVVCGGREMGKGCGLICVALRSPAARSKRGMCLRARTRGTRADWARRRTAHGRPPLLCACCVEWRGLGRRRRRPDPGTRFVSLSGHTRPCVGAPLSLASQEQRIARRRAMTAVQAAAPAAK